jgi:uncharacterized protein (DUF302 family)
MKTTFASLVLLAATSAVQADMITKPSPYSVAVTTDRLAAAVEKAGARVFARIDHAAGAAKVGAALAPNQMLMFGNPKLGTPAIQAAATMGLDLPLRVLIFAGPDGKVSVTYHDPADIAEYHGMAGDSSVVKKMQGALDKLTHAAVKPR